jgi:hypothetical protein
MSFYGASDLTTIYRNCLKNLARRDPADPAIIRLKDAVLLRLAELQRLELTS